MQFQIEATQTDGLGNRHAGEARTSSFVIHTIVHKVEIEDNKEGMNIGCDTVAYTLTFTEAVQSVAERDLQVDGADIVSVLPRGRFRHSDCNGEG